MEEVYFVIENSGATTAYDITFEVVPDNYEYKTNNSFKDFVPIKNGIPYLNPDQEIRYMLYGQHELEPNQDYCKLIASFKDINKNIAHSISFINFREGVIEYSNEEIVSKLSLIEGQLSTMVGAIVRFVTNIERKNE